MKKYLYIIFPLLCLVFSSACTDILEDDNVNNCPDNDGYTSLSITMNIPDMNISSRAVGPLESPTDNTNWSNWEKFCDGSLLYHVTIFVVNSEGTLVAYRDFYSGSDDIDTNNGFYEESDVNEKATTGVAVKATFSSKPNEQKHGEIEKLEAGETYKIYAVANYAAIDADKAELINSEKEYAGLGSETEDGTSNKNGVGVFPTIMSNIITNFGDTGIQSFTTTTYGSNFFNYQLNAGDDRMCKLFPQPLVMIREITLKGGKNTLQGELYRTFARIRLEFNNKDVEDPIGVSGLAFNGTYASQTAYLFNDRKAGNINLHDNFETETLNALDVTSYDAIFPFMNRTNQVLAGRSLTLLDCYILEGKTSTEGSHAFSYTTTYWTDPWSGSATQNVQITNWTTFLSYKVFIRQNTGTTNYILKALENADNTTIGIRNAGAAAEDNASTTLHPNCVWYIIPKGNTEIDSNELGFTEGYLLNVGTGKYLQAKEENSTALILGDYPSTLYFKINFEGTDEKGTVYCKSGDNYYYIASNSSVWTDFGTTAPSLTSGAYSYLTFETIPGEPKGPVTSNQTPTIDIEQNSNIEVNGVENVIIRNNFYHYVMNCKVTNATEPSVQPVEVTHKVLLNDNSTDLSNIYISVSDITTTTGSGQGQTATSSYVDGITYFYYDYYVEEGYLVVTIRYLLDSSDSTLPTGATINFGTRQQSGGGQGGGSSVTNNVTHSISVSDFIGATSDPITIKKKQN